MGFDRAILLGASNLQMGMPLLLENLRRRFSGSENQLEVWTASGHGRSYGRWSKVLFRELPGIVDCRLWDDLSASSLVPDATYALVTDIGNDILFGVEPVQIVDWVRRTLERLSQQKARIVVTGLPLLSVREMPNWKFRFFRRALFPNAQLGLAETLERAEFLQAAIEELAKEFGTQFIEPERSWYGFDPIHIHRGVRRTAWQRVLSGWNLFSETEVFSRAGWAAALHVGGAVPYEQRAFGRSRLTVQPVHRPSPKFNLSWAVY